MRLRFIWFRDLLKRDVLGIRTRVGNETALVLLANNFRPGHFCGDLYTVRLV